MKHQRLKLIIFCSNDNPVFILTYFTARSNFATSAFILKIVTMMETGERGCLVVNAWDSGSRGREFEAPLGLNRVVSLSKAHLLPKSTGYTQEAVTPP